MEINQNAKILIVGTGLIGGSYAQGLTEAGFEVGGVDKKQYNLNYCLERGWLAHGTTDPQPDYLGQFDIVILALYPQRVYDWIVLHMDALKPGALLTDTAGVKGSIVSSIQSALRPDLEFIGAHPMAGRERGGMEYAGAAIFKGANFIVTPTEKNTSAAVETAAQIGRVLGFKQIVTLSPAEHDEMIAFLSQMTHCVAVALMTCRECDGFEKYSGDSFRDLTRIAKIDEKMWPNLFALNKAELVAQMELFEAQFRRMREYIQNDETDKLREMMVLSTQRREKFDRDQAIGNSQQAIGNRQ